MSIKLHKKCWNISLDCYLALCLSAIFSWGVCCNLLGLNNCKTQGKVSHHIDTPLCHMLSSCYYDLNLHQLDTDCTKSLNIIKYTRKSVESNNSIDIYDYNSRNKYVTNFSKCIHKIRCRLA